MVFLGLVTKTSAVALCLLVVSSSSSSSATSFAVFADAKKNADDGKGVLISDLLAQPFRVALLKANTEGTAVGDAANQIQKKKNNAIQGIDNFAFSLISGNSSSSGHSGSTTSRSTARTAVLTSPIYYHPLGSSSSSSSSPSSPPLAFELAVTIDKYDNTELLKASRAKKDVLKAESYLRKSRYGQIYDTALTATVFGLPSPSSSSSSSPSAPLPLLALTTLNPYLPNTKAALGGRAGGGVTQALRYDATGHTEIFGIASADEGFWNRLVAASASSASASTSAGGSGSASPTTVLHGTFALTFVNRQEFTLRLVMEKKKMGNANTKKNNDDDKKKEVEEQVVTFYGFSTSPTEEAAMTFSQHVASYLGIQGSASPFSILETLFSLSHGSIATGIEGGVGLSASSSSSAPVAFSSFYATAAKIVAYPFTFMLSKASPSSASQNDHDGDGNHGGGRRYRYMATYDDEKARALAESFAHLANFIHGWWPLLLAVVGVLIAKTVADVVNRHKADKLQRDTDEQRRLKRESDERLAMLFGKSKKPSSS